MFGKATITSAFLAAVVAGLPTAESNDVYARAADRYTFYQGDGSTGAGWPSQNAWGSWDELWNANLPLMRQSCGWNGWGADNSGDEINSINSAIQQLASQTGVDRRFILAIMMQESKGCVRVPTTNNGVTNPGLMQSHNGSGTCAWTNPCPSWQVTQMISDGTAGTSSGAGLQQLLAQAQGAIGGGSRSFYAAARLYNSGSVDYSNLNNAFTSTRCYATDVANRLTGWTLAPSSCW
ncbi:glycoside hydrolase [Pochonia chlamydosporia 170]|uniref:Glycoside hydrolase n=1 Tax=Pochonia chlamydosporia 170 TaxID=1380566 RepID=A0A179EZR1_METCM|nr:glycoside hydrolase [Pochonia chlamydosporia 170]OAQ58500.1 glycoside hydrolase [Pochonia chlamydosporia 170]